MVKKCLYCNNEFETLNKRKIFCCRQCMYDNKNKRNSSILKEKNKESFEEYLKKHGSKRNCLYCDKEFEIKYPQQKNKIYCSKRCCKIVGNIFDENKSIRDSEYKNILKYGGNRHKRLIKDNHKCFFCDKSKDLIIHHIDLSGQTNNPNNDIDNLITLCRSCHIKFHKILPK